MLRLDLWIVEVEMFQLGLRAKKKRQNHGKVKVEETDEQSGVFDLAVHAQFCDVDEKDKAEKGERYDGWVEELKVGGTVSSGLEASQVDDGWFEELKVGERVSGLQAF